MRTTYILILFLMCVGVCVEASNVHAEERVYKLAVTDIAGLEELQREFKAFQDTLSKRSGVNVKLFPISSRTAVVEALKFKQIDFVLAGPAEYIVIAKKARATPLVGLRRPNYYSGIFVKKDSGITDISQLKGKKIALGDVGSTSYYLAPLQLLYEGGLNPKEDIRLLHVSKQIAFVSLKRGDVSAIGFNVERFKQYVKQDSSVNEDDFTLLTRGPDLPNDLIVYGSHVEPEIISKLKNAFVTYSDELISGILQGKSNNKYEGMKFLADIKDTDYNYTREMYRTAGFKQFG